MLQSNSHGYHSATKDLLPAIGREKEWAKYRDLLEWLKWLERDLAKNKNKKDSQETKTLKKVDFSISRPP